MSSVKDVNLAIKFLHWAQTQDGFQTNIRDYNRLLHKCVGNNDVEIAERIWAETREQRCEPDAVTYNSMINVMGKAGKFYESLAMFEEMQHRCQSYSNDS